MKYITICFDWINKFESNNFEVTLQVNSTRPVYNSTFTTPILNINDKDVGFKYIEFENLVYDDKVILDKFFNMHGTKAIQEHLED